MTTESRVSSREIELFFIESLQVILEIAMPIQGVTKFSKKTPPRLRKDSERERKGWFSDRQFRKSSQFKRYAKWAYIDWRKEYIQNDKVIWEKLTDIEIAEIRHQQREHMARCLVRSIPPKHKYVYILGETKNETQKLRKLFLKNNPEFENLAYPKLRGAVIDTAAKNSIKKENILTSNSEGNRPQDHSGRFQLPDKEFLTPKEVAEFMQISYWSVYSLIKKDPKFPALNVGIRKKYVIDRKRLENWIYDRNQRGEVECQT